MLSSTYQAPLAGGSVFVRNYVHNSFEHGVERGRSCYTTSRDLYNAISSKFVDLLNAGEGTEFMRGFVNWKDAK
jgi:hypothetical protein